MFYKIVPGDRQFNSGRFYADIDWNDLAVIVHAYRERLTWWYLDPAYHLETSDKRFEFPVMALSCILLDTLSQFFFGTTRSSRTDFKNFVRLHIAEYSVALPTRIRYQTANPKKPIDDLIDFADVLYHGFRCGILHDAHVAPYGMVRNGQLDRFEPVGFTEYVPSAPCPTVLIDAWMLRDRVKEVLNTYLDKLLNPDSVFDLLRTCFKTKFTESFGVDIAAGVLVQRELEESPR